MELAHNYIYRRVTGENKITWVRTHEPIEIVDSTDLFVSIRKTTDQWPSSVGRDEKLVRILIQKEHSLITVIIQSPKTLQ